MNVLVQNTNEQSWTPGTIKEKCNEPRSYVVEMSNGSVLRRNRRFLKELSPDACKKFNFSKNYVMDNQTCNAQPDVEYRADDNIKMQFQPESTDVFYENQTRVNSPVQHAVIPHRTTRSIRKPSRLVEEC